MSRVGATPVEQFDTLLDEQYRNARKRACRLELSVRTCWWTSILCAGLASALGFIAAIPEMNGLHKIEPWMISLFALISSGAELVRRKTNWRTKANTYYRLRDDIELIISQLRFELPRPVSDEDLKVLSKRYREVKMTFGDSMRLINATVEGDDETK